MKRAYCIGLVLLAVGASAEDSGADWKLYYHPQSGMDSHLCFYDAAGVQSNPGGFIAVTTECFAPQDMDGARADSGDGEPHATPRIAHIEQLTPEMVQRFAAYEAIAARGRLKPATTITYELNCADRMARERTATIRVGDEVQMSDQPKEWAPVPQRRELYPLFTLLCHPVAN